MHLYYNIKIFKKWQKRLEKDNFYGILFYYIYCAMFIAKYNLKKLWKYIDGLAILLCLDLWRTILKIKKTSFDHNVGNINRNSNLNKLIKKEYSRHRFEKTKHIRLILIKL